MMVFNVRVSCFPQLSVPQKIDTIWDDLGVSVDTQFLDKAGMIT